MDGQSRQAPASNAGSSPESEARTAQLRQILARLGYQQLNEINCTACGDEMVLTGKLDSFYLKQVAQSVAINIPGIRCVKNDILVV